MILVRKLILTLVCLFITSPLFACAVCFKGDPGQLQNQGLRAGIILLLVVLGVVVTLFISFFVTLIKKQKVCESNGF